MTKTIYLTGICGLLGSNLAKYFLIKGYNVKGCDNLLGGYEDNIPKKYIDFKQIDILDLDSLKNHMKGSDVIIHTAAIATEGLSVFSPALVTQSIYNGTLSVASAAISNNVELFLNCSSMARYGALEPPFTEDVKCKPEDPYGLAKYHAEQALNLLSDIHGIKVIHAVPHNIVGPGQRYNDPYRNVAAIFINRLLQDKHLTIYGDGSQKRSFSHVDDCVEPIYKLITNSDINNKEIFNIGPEGNEISIKELGFICGRAVKKYPHFEYFPNRPREVKNAWCSSKKAINKLEYNPTTKTEQIIKDLSEWIIKRGSLPFDYHLYVEIINNSTPKTWIEKLI